MSGHWRHRPVVDDHPHAAREALSQTSLRRSGGYAAFTESGLPAPRGAQPDFNAAGLEARSPARDPPYSSIVNMLSRNRELAAQHLPCDLPKSLRDLLVSPPAMAIDVALGTLAQRRDPLLGQALGAEDCAQEAAGGGASAVGVYTAHNRKCDGLLEVPLAVVEAGDRERGVVEGVGHGHVGVLLQDALSRLVPVLVFCAPLQRLFDALGRAAVLGDLGKADLDGFDGVIDRERGGDGCAEEHLAVDAGCAVADVRVLVRELRGLLRPARRGVTPGIAADVCADPVAEGVVYCATLSMADALLQVL